jgi:hypothetical protein
MFEENENLVNETENVEQTTEEIVEGTDVETSEEVANEGPVQMFTMEQVNEMIAKKLARKENKIRREYENKYSRLETVLNTGLGTESIEEATDKLSGFYKQKGINIPDSPKYSDREIEVLANAEADDIISGGYDEVVEEVDRLASIGVENMSERDKKVFSRLASERTKLEQEKALAKIGVGREVIDSKEFMDFAGKLNPNLSLEEKYEMYSKFNPKPKGKPIGSMKGNISKDNGVKDFYTYEESLQFTKEDLDRNPELFKALEKSMLRW